MFLTSPTLQAGINCTEHWIGAGAGVGVGVGVGIGVDGGAVTATDSERILLDSMDSWTWLLLSTYKRNVIPPPPAGASIWKKEELQ